MTTTGQPFDSMNFPSLSDHGENLTKDTVRDLVNHRVMLDIDVYERSLHVPFI